MNENIVISGQKVYHPLIVPIPGKRVRPLKDGEAVYPWFFRKYIVGAALNLGNRAFP
jgi:hypothetical protein